MISLDGSITHPHRLDLDDAALLAACEVDHYRSSGPGGQKRNKTSSAVRLRHRLTGLIVTASENRSQHVNQVYALRRLREAIALHVPLVIQLEQYVPSGILLETVSLETGTFRIGPRDPRYYQTIQELVGLLSACGMSVSDAARHLESSTAHLVKLLRSNPKLWKRVNDLRMEKGMKTLR